MYALSVSGAVNTQGFVWKFFMRYTKFLIHSFNTPNHNRISIYLLLLLLLLLLLFFGGGVTV